MLLCIEMGIIQLENQRTSDHLEFISKATNLIDEVKALKIELQKTLQDQENKSKQLIDETHTAYETGYSVLQGTFRGLRRSLKKKESVGEIFRLNKGIYKTLFNPEMLTNKEVIFQMATQFKTTF